MARSFEEVLARRAGSFGDVAGAVVFELVIVPGDEPGKGGVGGLEVRVGFVLGVAVAIVVERGELGADVLANAALAGRAFIDVVAEVDDQVEVLLGHVLVGGEEAGFVVLAGGEGEAESRRAGRTVAGSVRVRPMGLVSPAALN